MKTNISGIYAIVNKINNKRYIGSSKNIKHRWKQNHIPSLKFQNHHNRHLQSSWDKYGENNFYFEILEECPKNILLEREGYWIEKYRSWEREYGYNLTRIVDSKQVYSDESKSKIKNTKLQTLQDENYWTSGVNGQVLDMYSNGISKVLLQRS